VVVPFVLSGVALFAGGNLSPGIREDRANRWVIAAFALIGFLNAYLPAYTDRKEFWTIDTDTIRWLGVVLFAAGGAFRIWPVFVLGHRFSGLVAIQPGHSLVTGGVYGVIRHPSYLGLLVNSRGWSLAFRSGVGVLLTVLLIPPLLVRIGAEEKLLRAQFGAVQRLLRSHIATDSLGVLVRIQDLLRNFNSDKTVPSNVWSSMSRPIAAPTPTGLAEIVSDDLPVLHAHLTATNVFGITDKPAHSELIYPVIAAVTGPALTFAPPAFFGAYSKNWPVPRSMVRGPSPTLKVVFSPRRVIV